MKNVIILILFVSTVVAGYVAASSSLRLSREGMEGKLEKLIRGDLTIPINATGAVRPAQRVEIKSEASGEVIEIAKHGGDRVVAGDLLIRLQEDDERRNVNRARLDLKVAAANLEDTRIQLRLAETADLDNARARVDQLEQTVRLAKFRMDKFLELPEDQRSVEEMLERETTYRSQLAQRQQAQAAYDRAQQAIPSAKQRLLQAEARWETSKNNLGDAEKRLAKTKIIAPGDGVVADIRTRIGEVIQGGKTSLTGGTVLAVILDMSKIIVRAEVDEADIGRVLEIAPAWAQPGHDSSLQLPDDVRGAAESMEHLPVITVESFRDEKFQGIIERIFPEPKVLSGVVTYLVDVVVVSENRSKLLSGMRAEVTFTADHVENALLCPNEAVRKGPRGTLGVYVPKKNAPPSERATEFVPFTLGLDNGNYTQVVDGLEEGAVVYTKLPQKKEPEKKKKRRRR